MKASEKNLHAVFVYKYETRPIKVHAAKTPYGKPICNARVDTTCLVPGDLHDIDCKRCLKVIESMGI